MLFVKQCNHVICNLILTVLQLREKDQYNLFI